MTKEQKTMLLTMVNQKFNELYDTNPKKLGLLLKDFSQDLIENKTKNKDEKVFCIKFAGHLIDESGKKPIFCHQQTIFMSSKECCQKKIEQVFVHTRQEFENISPISIQGQTYYPKTNIAIVKAISREEFDLNCLAKGVSRDEVLDNFSWTIIKSRNAFKDFVKKVNKLNENYVKPPVVC